MRSNINTERGALPAWDTKKKGNHGVKLANIMASSFLCLNCSLACCSTWKVKEKDRELELEGDGKQLLVVFFFSRAQREECQTISDSSCVAAPSKHNSGYTKLGESRHNWQLAMIESESFLPGVVCQKVDDGSVREDTAAAPCLSLTCGF